VRIFEPFVQSGNAVAKEGTGLGLTISRDFVAMMGGSLEVDSELGAGATFHFTLELATSGAALAQEPTQRAPARGAERDLVDPSDVRDQLARLPLQVRTALREDLQKLDLHAVALILDSVAGDHPEVVGMIEQLLRQHQYPMLCSLLDEVQDVAS
jgi:hypothetical protein